MNPTSNEIERLVNACSTGNVEHVKSIYNRHGESMLSFKSSGVGDFKLPFYYAVRNGHMDVAKYLRSINPSNPNVILSKSEVYKIYKDFLTNKSFTRPGKKRRDQYHELCVELIIDGLSLFDRETIMLAGIDSTLDRLNIDLYYTLVDKFHVNPRNFLLRMTEDGVNVGRNINVLSPDYKTFTREIKLRNLLNDR